MSAGSLQVGTLNHFFCLLFAKNIGFPGGHIVFLKDLFYLFTLNPDYKKPIKWI